MPDALHALAIHRASIVYSTYQNTTAPPVLANSPAITIGEVVAAGQYLPAHAQLSRPKLSQPKLPRPKLRGKDPGPPCAAFGWEPITSVWGATRDGC